MTIAIGTGCSVPSFLFQYFFVNSVGSIRSCVDILHISLSLFQNHLFYLSFFFETNHPNHRCRQHHNHNHPHHTRLTFLFAAFAVGSPESDAVVVLRIRPIINARAYILTPASPVNSSNNLCPPNISIDRLTISGCLELKLCVNYSVSHAREQHDNLCKFHGNPIILFVCMLAQLFFFLSTFFLLCMVN